MSDPEATVPPNNPRGWLLRASRWARANPDLAFPLAAFALGVVLGGLVF